MRLFLTILIVVLCFIFPPFTIAGCIWLLIQFGKVAFKLMIGLILIGICGQLHVPIVVMALMVFVTWIVLILIGKKQMKNNPVEWERSRQIYKMNKMSK